MVYLWFFCICRKKSSLLGCGGDLVERLWYFFWWFYFLRETGMSELFGSRIVFLRHVFLNSQTGKRIPKCFKNLTEKKLYITGEETLWSHSLHIFQTTLRKSIGGECFEIIIFGVVFMFLKNFPNCFLFSCISVFPHSKKYFQAQLYYQVPFPNTFSVRMT